MSTSPRCLTELLEAIPEPSVLLTVGGEVLAWNRSALRTVEAAIHGERSSSPDEARRLRILSRAVGDPSTSFHAFLREAARSRSPVPGSLTVSRPEHPPVRLRCLGAAVRSVDESSGETVVGTSDESAVLIRFSRSAEASSQFLLLNEKIEELSREIHRRRRVEAEFRRNRAILEETQQMARLGSWEWDVTANELTWSDVLFEIYGLDPSDGPPQFEEYLERIAPEDRDQVRATVSRAQREGGSFSFDHGVVRRDGVRREVHGRGRAIQGPDGRVIRMRGSGQDITERKRREEQRRFLVESGKILTSSLDYHKTLEDVVNLAVSHVCTWCAVDVIDEGTAQRVTLAHRDPEKARAAREFYREHPPGFSPSSILGSILKDGIPRLHPRVDQGGLRDVARDAEHLRFLRDLDIRSAMLVPMSAHGSVLGVITFAGDGSRPPFDEDDLEFAMQFASVSALSVQNARAFRDAKRAIEVRDEMAAVVSHDLRSPLNAIAGAAGMLNELPLSPEDRAEQLAVILRSVNHMDRLTRDLLDVSRIEAGRFSICRSEESVDALLDAVADTWRARVGEKSLNYTSTVGPALSSGSFDRERLEQVLNNLVGNAVRFTPRGGSVRVSADLSGDDLRFEIRDTGPGLSEEELVHMFDRFWRSGESKDGGAGLGLAIAKGIVEAHGGRIEAANGDSGAIFRFWIPRAPSTQDETTG